MGQSASARFVSSLDHQGRMDVVVELREWVRGHLELYAGSTVVDVGCGTGDELMRLVSVVGAAGRAIGVDINDPMLSTARERTRSAHRVEIVKGDAASLPLPSGSVDALVCERVLQHLQYPPADAVREFGRVLRPGGRIGLTDTDWSSLQVLITDDAEASQILEEIQHSMPLPFTSNQEAGSHLEAYCREADLAVLHRRSLILGDFSPTLIQGVRAGLSSAASAVVSAQELEQAERLLDAAVERKTLRVAVRISSVIAERIAA